VTVTFLVALWAHPGRRAALHAYEDAVLALLPDHGGRVVSRVITPGGYEGAQEAQVIEFADREGFESYMNDPRRVARTAERDAAIAHTEMIEVEQAQPLLLGREDEAKMTLEEARDAFRAKAGRYGLWRRGVDMTPGFAAAAEAHGFGSVWVGGSPPADLAAVESLLDATARIIVATGIVNIWTAEAAAVAESFHRIEAAHPGRFLLGIGAGHPENQAGAVRPYSGLVDYLDVLDREGVPAQRIVLAALGDRSLRLAGERTLGAHPYFVPPEHTRHARDLIGSSPLLIPEQRVALEIRPESARELLRPGMKPYFRLKNYRDNLLRLGFDAAAVDAAGDDMIDRIAVWGEGAKVKAGLDAQLLAGADHVLAQLVVPEGVDPLVQVDELARFLGVGGAMSTPDDPDQLLR